MSSQKLKSFDKSISVPVLFDSIVNNLVLFITAKGGVLHLWLVMTKRIFLYEK